MEASVLEAIRVKVHAFRIAEAKEVLQQLGLAKHGRKEELSARILTIFQDAATLTAQGHKLKDQARVDAAAAIVDAVFQRLLRSDYGPAVAAAHRLGGAAAAAAGDLGPSAKRPRLAHPMLPQQRAFGRGPGSGGAAAAAAAAAGGGGLEDGEDDIITAFMNGEEGIGASNTRVRCVCSDHKRREPMLQCEGAFCGVWQHAGCVKQQLLHSPLVPHLPGSDKWPKRRQFFCERCRVARADPFWEVYDTLVMPPQLGKPTAGRMRLQDYANRTVEWTVSTAGPARISLSSHQVKLLQDSPHEFQLQAMALCLDDKIQFRLQWPTAPLLRFSGKQLRVTNRASGIALGVMQRDTPTNLTPLVPLAAVQQSGGLVLDVCLEFADPNHSVLLLAYIMRKRTRDQVKALMKPPEPLAAAVQRVRHFMNPRAAASSSTTPAAAAAAAGAGHGRGGGGQQQQQAAAAAAAAEELVISDEDDIVLGNRVVSLKDPNTFLRVRNPARFTDSGANDDLQTFELESFLDMAAKTLKWIDPHSMKASCVQHLQVDSYLAHIVSCLAAQPDVLEVEINQQAEWRPAGTNAPFRPVLQADGHTPAAVSGPAGAAGDGEHSSDEEDEAAELRRAASEMRRGKQHEVIELLDSDDEGPGQQQQQPPPQQQQQQGGGLRILLPNRAQQQQQHLQQQQAAAAGRVAAAAVGPPVPHLQPGAAGAGGVMSPRVVPGNAPHQQQQQQQQGGFPGQHVWQQQQPPPPGASIPMQQQPPPGAGGMPVQQGPPVGQQGQQLQYVQLGPGLQPTLVRVGVGPPGGAPQGFYAVPVVSGGMLFPGGVLGVGQLPMQLPQGLQQGGGGGLPPPQQQHQPPYQQPQYQQQQQQQGYGGM